MDDSEIVKELILKNEKALEILMKKYTSLIFGVIKKVLKFNYDNGEIEEVYYHVILKLWDNIQYYDEEKGEFIHFLISVSRYSAIDYLRKTRKKDDLELKEEILRELGYDEKLNGVDEKEEFIKLLKVLKNEDKEIFIRRYYLCEDIKTISKALGKSEKYLYTRLSRGRSKLKKSLGGAIYE